MKINYHPVGIKISDSLKTQFEKKLARVVHLFHNVTQVDLFLKVERASHIMELLINADNEKFFFTQKADDMYKCLEFLVERAFENARKFKSRQHHHHSAMAAHHNYLVLTRNIESHKEMEEELDVFSSKPLSRFEAFLELRASDSNLLVYRDLKDNSVNLMIREKTGFFLIRRQHPFLGIIGPKSRFVQTRFEYRDSRFAALSRETVRIEPMDRKAVMEKVAKQDFCFYINEKTRDFNVLFRYGKNKLGLVEHIEVR